ncbi:MAG: GNAT family N-acetyltransferase [Lachnospiraceae bacterium]|nr:GNAT family N-acetyltransferase [Lachnospiraceae bacterium]
MNFRRCEKSDFDRLQAFYQFVSSHTPDMEKYGRWIYGKHPTDAIIQSHIDAGCMYCWEKDGSILAATALTPFQGNDYHSTNWNIDAKDDEVLVVHILCVSPNYQRTGVAPKVMKDVIELAAKLGKKAVRLDALSCNEPAHRLYEKLGFKKCGVQNWYTRNAGWIDFYLYEYCL